MISGAFLVGNPATRRRLVSDATIWGLHMGAEHGDEPLKQDYVAIGWPELGNLSAIDPNREAFKVAYLKAKPSAKPGNVAVSAGVPYRFAVEIKIGDLVVYPSKSDRMVNIGRFAGPYRYDPGRFLYPNERPVTWLKQLPRAAFSQTALNEIGSAITLFRVSTTADEFIAALSGEAFQPTDIDEVNAERVTAQVEESTEDFVVKRLKNAQTPYQFEQFVAHLLTRM